MHVVVSGGSGFIGKALVRRLLEGGHRVTLLTRRPEGVRRGVEGSVQTVAWDGRTVGVWAPSLNGTNAVINLAGEPIVARRWTEAQKAIILDSRVRTTRALIEAISQAKKRPSVLVNASAVGYYGPRDDEELTERSPSGRGFLAELCRSWEQEAQQAQVLGVRVVVLRIGIVLSADGGALSKMVPPFQWGLGGPLGSGRQWMSWIHRDDLLGLIAWALSRPDVAGPVNATAPQPVRMREFCQALGRALHRPSWAPVPAPMLRLLLGEMAEVLLTGQRVIPDAALRAGHPFQFSDLTSALVACLSTSR